MRDSILFNIISLVSISYCVILLNFFSQLQSYISGTDNEETDSCRVPQLNPFDVTVLDFIEKPYNFTCSSNGPLVISGLHNLQVDRSLLPAYGVKNIAKFKCCYQAFVRDIPEEDKSDHGIVYVNNCKPFFFNVKVDDEFVEVTCKYRKKQIYYDFFSFVPIKRNSNRNKISNTTRKLNVLIFGIDSLSHMNFQRNMPKTKKYVDEHLNSILMSGYNKVGDNTFPNLIPILTGQSEEELTKTCWKTLKTKFDECHFIWNDYSDAGYLTAYAEDFSFLGLFNFGRLGFQVQPTHYYWKTFNYRAEQKLRNDLCLGPRPLYQVVIDYTKKFVTTLRDDPFFGIFWSSSLTHSDLNSAPLSDDDYVDFFRYLKTENVLNNTVVIFMSDHGFRFGNFVETHRGHMEERLPFLYFIFPKWFNKLYPTAIKNMKNNTNRLTANFDIHETLKDLLNLTELKTKYLMNNGEDSMGKRGISLFSLVPENRSCQMAGIPSHWCVCKRGFQVYTFSTAVIKIANFIVSYLNNLLVDHKECAQLKLKQINLALLWKEKKHSKYLKEYTITLETIPGDAIFQSTVQCFDTCYEEKSYTISDSISRINRYANQSSCISHHILRKYCYCMQ